MTVSGAEQVHPMPKEQKETTEMCVAGEVI